MSVVAAVDCGTNTIKLLIAPVVGQSLPDVAVLEEAIGRIGDFLAGRRS